MQADVEEEEEEGQELEDDELEWAANRKLKLAERVEVWS